MVTLYDRIWTRGPNSNIVHFLILIAHKITIFVRIMSSKLLWVKKQYRLYIRKSLPMIGRPVNIYWPFFKNYVRIRAPYVTCAWHVESGKQRQTKKFADNIFKFILLFESYGNFCF